MIAPTVTKEEMDARRGRYVARLPDLDAEAELIFTHRGPNLISADHTIVPEVMGGRGVGKALLDALLADARGEGFKIIPYCVYVRGQYAKHPEWSGLFTTRPGEDPR